MINNKRVNVWRGDEVPPTIYDVWIKDNTKLLLYNGVEWVIFIDDVATIQKIEELTSRLDDIEQTIQSIEDHTINGKHIRDNPVLDGDDLLTANQGYFINASETVGQSIQKLDTLLTTIIIE